LSLFALFAIAVAGCGSDIPDYPETTPVTGKVTQGGKPVDGALVQFVPPRQQGGGKDVFAATAKTGTDGSYSLSTYFSPAVTAEGAVPGQYTVTVTKYPPVSAESAHGDAHAESS